MNKNKKLISLVCAIAMIFSMLSGLAITANAADKGYTVSDVTVSEDGKTASFKVGYTGFEGGITNGKFDINIPVDASAIKKVTNAKADILGNAIPSAASDLPKYSVSFTCALDEEFNSVATKSEDTLTTITIEFNDAIANDIEIKIANDSYIATSPAATDKYTVGADGANGITSGSAVLHNPNAPTPKPTTSTTPVPVATEKPADPDKPVVVDPVVPAKGYTLSTPVVSADGKTITFDVGYTGFEGGITNGKFDVTIPTDASNIKKVTNAKADILGNAIPSAASDLPKYSVSFTCALDEEFNSVATKSEDKLTTITVELNNKLENDTNIVIADESYIATSPAAADKYTVGADGDHGLTAAKQVIKAVGSSEEEPQTVVGTVDLDKAITTTVTDTPDATTKESEYFIIPKVTVTEGGVTKDATYGEQADYVAVIGDTVLTEAQYSNLINGHLGADNVKDIVAAKEIKDINDVISKIGLRMYNNTAKVSAQLVNRTTGEIENGDDGEVDVKPATDTPTPKPTAAPTMSIAVTSGGKAVTSVEVKSIVTVTVNVPAAVQVEGAKLDKDLVLDHADYLELIASTVNDNTAEYKYQAVKAGNVKITANYVKETVKTAAEDTTTTTTKETVASANTSLKITAAKSTGGGSSSSSSSSDKNTSSGGGAIATGLVDVGGTGNLFGFTDMGDASWATDAVNALAARKIVSGVGDNQFDPNGALTRAAYAQMLINAIGHNTDSADTEFADVPTDAWFYHNVAVAAQLGIVSGYGDGNFGPYDLITREQMALMTQKASVVMAKSLVGADAGTFTDDADIADWSRDAVYQLANAGIINGMGDGTFAPKANATRAQAAVIIYNTFVK